MFNSYELTDQFLKVELIITLFLYFSRCYDCDDELQIEKYKKVAECVEHVKKLACVSSTDGPQGRELYAMY